MEQGCDPSASWPPCPPPHPGSLSVVDVLVPPIFLVGLIVIDEAWINIRMSNIGVKKSCNLDFPGDLGVKIFSPKQGVLENLWLKSRSHYLAK